jgi:hypothetical protein
MATNPYPPTSRYANLDVANWQPTPEDTPVPYLRRRFLPQADQFVLLQLYIVRQGDRLDNITAKYLGDPEQFWRVCDANNAMRPDDLTETVGRRLRITLPQGIQGVANG